MYRYSQVHVNKFHCMQNKIMQPNQVKQTISVERDLK